jgi:hypothetical protein
MPMIAIMAKRIIPTLSLLPLSSEKLKRGIVLRPNGDGSLGIYTHPTSLELDE